MFYFIFNTMSNWEKLFLLLVGGILPFMFFDFKNPIQIIDTSQKLSYIDTVKYIQPPPTDTCRREYDYKHSYLKLSGTTYLEIPSIEFHYLYNRNKKGSFDEIGYKIPIDTTIEFFSPNKDTVYYLTINKDE